MKTIIIGAGISGTALLEMIDNNEYTIVAFIDDDKAKHGKVIGGVPVVGNASLIKNFAEALPVGAIVSITDNSSRKKIYKALKTLGFTILKVINQNSIINDKVKIQEGTVIMAGVIINSNVNIGVNNIVQSGAIIESNTFIGDHTLISSGAIIGSDVKIGESVMIGMGSIIASGISISDNSVVAAGTVVSSDI